MIEQPTPSSDDAFVAGLCDGQEAYESGIIPTIRVVWRQSREIYDSYLAGYGAAWRANAEADRIKEEARNG